MDVAVRRAVAAWRRGNNQRYAAGIPLLKRTGDIRLIFSGSRVSSLPVAAQYASPAHHFYPLTIRSVSHANRYPASARQKSCRGPRLFTPGKWIPYSASNPAKRLTWCGADADKRRLNSSGSIIIDANRE